MAGLGILKKTRSFLGMKIDVNCGNTNLNVDMIVADVIAIWEKKKSEVLFVQEKSWKVVI